MSSSLETECRRALCTLWRIQVSTKIKSFGWRIFLNRLTMKDQLKKRGLCLSINDETCVFCLQSDEDLNHILFECPMSSKA